MLPSPEPVFSVEIAQDHPATDGHFAGTPLVPGVVILEYVRAALKALDQDLYLQRFGRVKFTRPLLPGNRLTVSLAEKGQNQFRFTCTDGGNGSIATGEFVTERI